MGATAIARELGINRDSVYRLLKTTYKIKMTRKVRDLHNKSLTNFVIG